MGVTGECTALVGLAVAEVEVTNTRDPQASLGTPTDVSAVTDVHRLLLSAMRSNYDIDWLVNFLMLSFHDLCSLRLPFTVH